LFPQALQEAAHDSLPVYQPPEQPPAGRYRLVIGRKAFFTHASTSTNPWLFEFATENRLWMNPVSAQTAGVADGDWVEVASRVGVARLRAKVTEEIRPDCVFMLHGYGKRSPKLRHVYNKGGSDAALLETAWDKVSGNAAMHETFVKVRRV